MVDAPNTSPPGSSTGSVRPAATRSSKADGPVAALSPEQDPGAHLGRSAAHGVRHGHEGVAHECRRGLRVLEDVGDLVGGEAVVHRDGNGARRPDRGRGDEHLEAVVRVEDDVLPGRDPEPDERMREAVARVPELGPGEPAVAFDQGGPLGVPLRMRRDNVHVRSSDSSCRSDVAARARGHEQAAAVSKLTTARCGSAKSRHAHTGRREGSRCEAARARQPEAYLPYVEGLPRPRQRSRWALIGVRLKRRGLRASSGA